MNIDTNGPDAGRSRMDRSFHMERSFRIRRRREPAVQIVIGLIVVALGVLFTLDNLHLVHARDYLRFWPAAFVAVGLAQFAQAQSRGRRLAGLLWVGAALVSWSGEVEMVDHVRPALLNGIGVAAFAVGAQVGARSRGHKSSY